MRNLNPEHEIIGVSAGVKEVRQLIEEFAPLDMPVLITGETGTGKEDVAYHLHIKSPRRSGPFVAVNCSCFPRELAESQIFGHEKGAFTGACSSAPGMFELAYGGTLFLDEISAMPLDIQPKLLRVLEDGVVRHVGSRRNIETDVRVLAATNAELERSHEFRQDLFYRLDAGRIRVPPLRERPEDIEMLAHHYVSRLNEIHGAQKKLPQGTLSILQRYSFPGNVRELQNILAYAFARSHGDIIEAYPVKEKTSSEYTGENALPAEQLERQYKTAIEGLAVKALRENRGNMADAARRLGIKRTGLYYLIEKQWGYKTVEDFFASNGIPPGRLHRKHG